MPRLLLPARLVFSAIGLSLVGCVAERPKQPAPVSLAGLATAELPSSFRAVGPQFDPASLDLHRDARQITFRFEQGQRRNMGGHFMDPVLLNVTLFNPALPAPDATRVTHTTVNRFYPPVDPDPPRFAAHFAAQRWLPAVTHGAAATHSAATNEGRGDNLVHGPPERWLVIHVDPVRRVRVDLYTWRSAYSLENARALVRGVAESVQATPKLRELFEGVKTVDERLATRHARAVSAAVARLRACGIESMDPGSIAWSGACAAWLSDDRRYLHVARAMGRVPGAAATRPPGEAPEFRVAELPPGRPASLIGPPEFQMAMFYWDAAAGRWGLERLGARLYDDEPRESPLVAAIAARLGERGSMYLVCLARYDVEFMPDRVDVDAFLFESSRVAAALRAGTLIPGVKAASDAFGH